MKKATAILVLLIFACQTTLCYAYPSQALEKIPKKYIDSDVIINYVKNELDFSEYDMTTWDEVKAASDAGWSAFNQNLGLQGAAFTAMEEGLSFGFLKNINSAFEKIGAGLIVLQFGIDLITKDFKTASKNFSKSSIFFAIGKWGTRGMKLGVAGAIAVEWYLGAIAGILYDKHDTFWHDALRWYFQESDGAISLEDLKTTFNAEQETAIAKGKTLEKEDVMRILDDYLEREIWAPGQLILIEGTYRGANVGAAGSVRASKGRLKTEKESFNNYIKAVIVLPHLKAFFKQMVEDSIEKETARITKIFKKLITEYNREYRLTGRVIGPKDEIKGLKVAMPGFLETKTDENGKYEFRFTLYAFLKSDFWKKNKGSGMEIDLEVPTKEGVKVLTRKGKIRTQHRNKGLINVRPFHLDLNFYEKYCEEYMKYKDVFYGDMDTEMRQALTYKSKEHCVSKLTKQEEEAIEIFKKQGESEARIKQGVDGIRQMYKMGLTRSGCTNMYGGFCKMMGMGIQDGSAPADVVAKVRSEIDSCVRKATEGCQRLPEKLDW